MIKNIKINKEQSVTLNSAAGWLFVYREQFGRDILPDIMPMIEGFLSASIKIMQNMDETRDIITAVDDSTLTDLFINLSGLETVTVLQIVWAMARNADDDLAPPEIWVNQFDVFPFDVIVPKVLRLIIDSSVSSKNAKRLLTLLQTTAGSLSIKSQ